MRATTRACTEFVYFTPSRPVRQSADKPHYVKSKYAMLIGSGTFRVTLARGVSGIDLAKGLKIRTTWRQQVEREGVVQLILGDQGEPHLFEKFCVGDLRASRRCGDTNVSFGP